MARNEAAGRQDHSVVRVRTAHEKGCMNERSAFRFDGQTYKTDIPDRDSPEMRRVGAAMVGLVGEACRFPQLVEPLRAIVQICVAGFLLARLIVTALSSVSCCITSSAGGSPPYQKNRNGCAVSGFPAWSAVGCNRLPSRLIDCKDLGRSAPILRPNRGCRIPPVLRHRTRLRARIYHLAKSTRGYG